MIIDPKKRKAPVIKKKKEEVKSYVLDPKNPSKLQENPAYKKKPIKVVKKKEPKHLIKDGHIQLNTKYKK
jgi:hypothetical protein